MKFADLDFAAWQALGKDAGSMVADPKFVDAAHFDFHLQPDSPADKIGFRPFDFSKAGVYGDEAWHKEATSIHYPPVRCPPNGVTQADLAAIIRDLHIEKPDAKPYLTLREWMDEAPASPAGLSPERRAALLRMGDPVAEHATGRRGVVDSSDHQPWPALLARHLDMGRGLSCSWPGSRRA